MGVILSDDGREILMETEELGKIYIPKASIKSIKNVGDEDYNKDGGYEPKGPFATRYYFTTNALPLEKGDNYAMIHLYGPEVHMSLGKGFSAGIMTTWWASPFVLALKKSFKTKNDKVNLALGTLIGTSGYFNQFSGYGGLHWGTFTYGSHANNVSLSAGYGYFDAGNNSVFGRPIVAEDGIYNDWDQIYSNDAQFKHSPIFQVAATKKLGKSVSFIFDSMFSLSNQKYKTVTTDHWNNPNLEPGQIQVSTSKEFTAMFFVMPGMRFQKSDKNAFQVALAGATFARQNQVISFPVPQCSWFFKF
jgi:hypothetical protein